MFFLNSRNQITRDLFFLPEILWLELDTHVSVYVWLLKSIMKLLEKHAVVNCSGIYIFVIRLIHSLLQLCQAYNQWPYNYITRLPRILNCCPYMCWWYLLKSVNGSIMTLSSLTSDYYPHPLGSFYSKCIAVGYLCNLNFLIFKIGIIITISQGYYEVRWANTESYI